MAAADKLSLTSSAISKSVARLEERLGIRLFTRTTRSLQLTEAGRAFYETCSRVLKELAEAEAILALQKAELSGRLCIGLPASYGRARVMPVLLRFFAQNNDIRPRILFSDRFLDLTEERVDLVVRIGGSQALPPSLAQRTLGYEKLIFCASPDYLVSRGKPRNFHDLAEHDYIVFGRADGSTIPWLFPVQSCLVERHKYPPRIIAGDGEAVLDSVRAGLGIAQLATWLVEADLRSGRLVQVVNELETDGLPLRLIWPVARQLVPAVDAVIDVLSYELKI